MKTYLITGGNGYIGSHMAKLLFELGHQVLIIDNHKTSPTQKTHAYGKFFDFCISDCAKLENLCRNYSVDAVFHFAGSAVVNESELDPIKYFQNNVENSLCFIRTCVKLGIKNFIFSSTCATYGVPLCPEISEEAIQAPVNVYGQTKLMIESCLKELSRLKLMNVAVLRYFNVAGAHPDKSIGENHNPETHLIPKLVESYLSHGLMPFTIFGDQYKTPDGTCIRDYVHICDLVDGHWQALKYIEKNDGYHPFNLGSGHGYSVKQVLESFEKVVQAKLDVKVGKPREGDPPCLIADIRKATKLLGFKPKYNLDDCIEHAINYASKYENTAADAV